MKNTRQIFHIYGNMTPHLSGVFRVTAFGPRDFTARFGVVELYFEMTPEIARQAAGIVVGSPVRVWAAAKKTTERGGPEWLVTRIELLEGALDLKRVVRRGSPCKRERKGEREEFRNADDAAEQTGYSRGTIARWIRSGTRAADGWWWS